jgi:hypothetical protein
MKSVDSRCLWSPRGPREDGLRAWEGMQGFHGNPGLPVAKAAVQIRQAPSPRLDRDVRSR